MVLAWLQAEGPESCGPFLDVGDTQEPFVLRPRSAARCWESTAAGAAARSWLFPAWQRCHEAQNNNQELSRGTDLGGRIQHARVQRLAPGGGEGGGSDHGAELQVHTLPWAHCLELSSAGTQS